MCEAEESPVLAAQNLVEVLVGVVPGSEELSDEWFAKAVVGAFHFIEAKVCLKAIAKGLSSGGS